jgi:tungstate transport system substrate-binding protein
VREKGAWATVIDWLVSPGGQRAIADYKSNSENLFLPNGQDPDL